MALFKKGKRPMKGKKKRDDQQYVMAEGYQDMITPRGDGQMMQNMERVDEDQEEEVAGLEESHQ